jgi:hypothetical protein
VLTRHDLKCRHGKAQSWKDERGALLKVPHGNHPLAFPHNRFFLPWSRPTQLGSPRIPHRLHDVMIGEPPRERLSPDFDFFNSPIWSGNRSSPRMPSRIGSFTGIWTFRFGNSFTPLNPDQQALRCSSEGMMPKST